MSTTDNGERKSKRTAPPIGKAEALELLASAVSYCQSAGLTVRAGNVGGALTLAIDGAALAGDPARFELSEAGDVASRHGRPLATV